MLISNTTHRLRRLGAVALAALLAACSSATNPSDGGSDVITADNVTRDTGPVRVPMNHRPSAVTCPTPPPLEDAGSPTTDAGVSQPCTTNADCNARPGGHCASTRLGMVCSYDSCYADTDCAGASGTSGVCACGAGVFANSEANVCIAGNCRVDADCGANGYCSPTYETSCGPYSGWQGFYCHTQSDECVDDADCVSPTMGMGYCAYQPTVSHWICGYSRCAG